MEQFFQASASVYAAARECAERRLPLTRLPERFRADDNPPEHVSKQYPFINT